MVLILVGALAGGAFAQGKTWYNSYAPGIEGTQFLINVGIGAGNLPYKTSLPAISASAEYELANIPLSVGAYFGITGYSEDTTIFTTTYTYKGTRTGIGAKASYHFNFIRNFDPYVSLVLGWLVWSEEHTAAGVTRKYDYSRFFPAYNIGARYFFTNSIGAYLELGYSAVSIASVGLAVKF